MSRATLAESEKWRAEFIALIRRGVIQAEALRRLGKTKKTIYYWTDKSPEWATELEEAKAFAARREVHEKKEVPDFPEFCKQYLGMELFWHQLQWFDLLEGREPRDLHPAQIYHRGNDGYEDRDDLIIINTPPDHAKSTTVTVAYVVWSLCRDPNDLIVIISKTQTKAKEFLKAIKDRLTHPKYQALQDDFGPPEGFAENSGGWTADRIWLSSDIRDPDEKDPNVQALGIGGHIYGTRSNKIILDDPVDSTNVQHFAAQIEWISGHIISRVGQNGRVVLVGTRIAAVDLYKEARSDTYYNGNPSPWGYLSQPAILEDSDDVEKIKTLWPRSNRPARGDFTTKPDPDGYYPMWDGRTLTRKRRSMTARTWALMYMQLEIEDDAMFPLEALRACTNGNRTAGPLQLGNRFHRARGMSGLSIIAGLDPAVTKDTGAVVIGLDRDTAKRYVLDVYAQPTKPDGIFELMRSWTDRYKIQEWRVEKNGLNLMVTQNRAIVQWLNARGVILSEHYTSENKWDPMFGVASLTSLIQGWSKDPNEHSALLELPSQHNHAGTRKLVQQMSVWSPQGDPKTTPQDTVMALWFAEIRCRMIADDLFIDHHFENEWLTQADKDGQIVLDLDDPELEQSWM